MFNLSFIELFILNTIVYFDIFDYPLTANEICSNLFTGGMEGPTFSLAEIEACLKNSPKLNKIITTQSGFYFLKKRADIIFSRLERYNLADKKYRIAKRAVSLFKYLPFLKLVAACNNLGYSNVTVESDIDLFVITAPQRIWLSRLFLIAIIFILRLRPPKEKAKAKDKICLSYYITTEDLNLEKTKVVEPDIHLIYWLSAFIKIYEREDYFEKFYQANFWLKKYLPNWQMPIFGCRRVIVDNLFNKAIYKLKEFIWSNKIGDSLEHWAKNLQLKYMAQRKKDIAVSQRNWVIISDTMLKFHENDTRQHYLELFEAKRKEVLKKL